MLIDDRVSLIDQSGAPQARSISLYNPPLIDPKLDCASPACTTSVNLGLSLLESNHQSLLFARTRRTVEMLLTYLLEKMPYQLRPKVRGYRRGTLRAIAGKLSKGSRMGAFASWLPPQRLNSASTSVSLNQSSWLATRVSIATTLQRAGRAGRKQQDSLALMVATNDAMDQYLANHPESSEQLT